MTHKPEKCNICMLNVMVDDQNQKISFFIFQVAPLLVCTFVIKNVICASIQAPLSIISLDDLTESERKILEQLDLNNWPPRPKRSSSEAISAIKEALANSIKSKLGMIAKGSASKISHLSSGSSGKYHDVPEVGIFY